MSFTKLFQIIPSITIASILKMVFLIVKFWAYLPHFKTYCKLIVKLNACITKDVVFCTKKDERDDEACLIQAKPLPTRIRKFKQVNF